MRRDVPLVSMNPRSLGTLLTPGIALGVELVQKNEAVARLLGRSRVVAKYGREGARFVHTDSKWRDVVVIFRVDSFEWNLRRAGTSGTSS